MQEREYERFVWMLKDSTRGMFGNPDIAALCAAYVMLKARENGLVDVESPKSFLAECKVKKSISDFVCGTIEKNWNVFRSLIASADVDVLKKYVADWKDMSRFGSGETPRMVLKAVFGLLNLDERDKSFADFGCGTGGVLIAAHEDAASPTSVGYELSNDFAAIAEMRLSALDLLDAVRIERKNIFSISEKDQKFDKIFCCPPFGVRYQDEATRSFVKSLPALPDLRPSSSTTWLYALRTIESLKPGGKCAIIVNEAPLFNQADLAVRKYLVDRNFIEAVVSLPPFLFPQTGTPVSLIVLNVAKESNKVKMIDASGLGLRGKGRVALRDDDVDMILSCVNGKPTKAKLPSETVENGVIAKEEYMLYPRRYVKFADDVEIKNGKALGDVVSIRRGMSLTSRELESLRVDGKSPYHYATQANIKDGVIEGNGESLREIPKDNRRFCAEDGDLVLTKVGRPIKCAVVRLDEGEKLLIGANQYIITPNTKKVEPHFLQAFFESGAGRSALAKISVGVAVPAIALRDLKELVIPVPSMEVQKKVAIAYRAKLDEVALLRRKLARAIDGLDRVYDESFGGAS